jgi:hypothetical protein
MNDELETMWKEAIIAYFYCYRGIFLERQSKNLENPQTERPVFGPRFERGTSRIRSRRVTQSTTTFGVVFVICVHTQRLIELLGLHEIY